MIELIIKSKEILENKIFKRKYYLEKINTLVSKKNILVISGQRKTWKSYIIKNNNDL